LKKIAPFFSRKNRQAPAPDDFKLGLNNDVPSVAAPQGANPGHTQEVLGRLCRDIHGGLACSQGTTFF
jgi:hypothetical protein